MNYFSLIHGTLDNKAESKTFLSPSSKSPRWFYEKTASNALFAPEFSNTSLNAPM